MNYFEYRREVLINVPWREFGLPRKGRALVVGSASGWELEALSALGLDAVGIDVKPFGSAVVRGSATALPFRIGSFEALVCNRTLPHIPDVRSAIREFARVLVPDGRLLLTVGNRYAYTFLSLRLDAGRRIPNPNDSFYQLYTRAEISRLLAGAGFEVRGLRTCHYAPRQWAGNGSTEFLRILARLDHPLGRNLISGRFGPLLLVYGVLR